VTFNSTANTAFTLQFFQNSACAPPARPAEIVVATINVSTGADGNVTQTTFTLPLIAVGSAVTVMATGPDGTSELSACVPVISGTPLNFAVLNTNDSGPGSLRQTIIDANSHPGLDGISFNIAGTGPVTISPATALPAITGPVTINGWTQLGHITGGPPVVEIRGNDTIAEGFSVSGSGTTIRGLVINGFGYGIAANASSDLRVEANYVGTDLTGTTRVPNRLGGVFIWNSTNATVVGNLISGQGTIGLPARVDGMQISGCSGTRIQGNRIGTNAAATAALGNAGFGIVVSGTGTATTEITDNVISGNPFGGISIQMGAHGTIVQSNLIGTGTDTAVEIGNGRAGFVDGGGINISDAPGNTIESNTIAHNLGPGVFGQGAASTGNRILGNAIWHNGGMGIDLWGDYGVTANSNPETIGRQNFPVITSAQALGGQTIVNGTLVSTASAPFRIDVFSNGACDWTGGNGEGATLLGTFTVNTAADSTATFTETLPGTTAGTALTATATRWNTGGGSSELSACVPVTAGSPLPDTAVNANGSEGTPPGASYTLKLALW
jgi:hypothetical protein